MQNFDNLKNIWQQSGSDKELPSAKVVLEKVAAARKKMIRKNILVITMLSFTFAYIIWVGAHYDFALITTRIGIVITLTAIVTGIVFNTKLARTLAKQNDPTLSNDEYLQQMILFRSQQRRIQTTGISVYFLLLSAGIASYMYEFAVRDLLFGIISYTITFAWIAFNWFYLRRRSIAKQEKQINEQIGLLEGLNRKLNVD